MSHDKKQKKKESEGRLAMSLSIIALIISAVSFYLDHFYIKHNLRATVVHSNFDPNKDSLDAETEMVVLNDGNQTEVLLEADLIYEGPHDSGNLRSRLTGPHILKPGEAVAITNVVITPKEQLKGEAYWSKEDGRDMAYVNASIHFVSVGENGEPVKTTNLLSRMQAIGGDDWEPIAGDLKRQTNTHLYFQSLLGK